MGSDQTHRTAKNCLTPNTGASLHRRYPASPVLRAYPPPHDARPIRHRRPVGRPRPRHRASRVACAFLVYMLPPLPRRGNGWSNLAHPSRRISLPRNGSRAGPRIVLFEACSAFTLVAACTLALPPSRGSLTRRLQPCRFLYSCSGASGWSISPGGPLTHWKTPPWHGARQFRTFGPVT